MHGLHSTYICKPPSAYIVLTALHMDNDVGCVGRAAHFVKWRAKQTLAIADDGCIGSIEIAKTMNQFCSR